MIIGVGTDIVLISRIEASLSRFGERFAKRILSADEISGTNSLSASYVAKRFAAKESVSKALGTGMRRGVTFRSISIMNDANGKPFVQLSGATLIRAEQLGVAKWHLSLSDEKDHALAFVVAES